MADCPTEDTVKGKDEIARLAANHWAASPGRIKTLMNLFANEEYSSLEYRTAGTLTDQADFPSIKLEPTGKKYDFLYSFVFLATRSVAARNHTDGLGVKPTNVFANAEGTKLCWEYVHTGVVTDKWPSSAPQKPAPGTKFDMPISLMCEIRQGKLDKVREYFNLQTVTEPGVTHKLYS
jgi:hypothetical protein